MKTKKNVFPEESLIRDSSGTIDLNETVIRESNKIRAQVTKIIEEEKFDLSDKEIKELCLSVFYARPTLKFIARGPMVMLAIQQIEVPPRRFNVILDKFTNWIKQDTAAKRGSFRMEGNNVVLRSRYNKR